MKKYIILLTLFVTCSATCYADQPTTSYDGTFFQLVYPAQWHQTDYPLDKSTVLFLERKYSEKDIGTLAFRVAPTLTDSGYLKYLRTEVDQFTTRLKSRFPDAMLLSSVQTSLGGYDAQAIFHSYSVKNPGTNYEIINLQIHCVKNKKLFMIVYETVETEDYEGKMDEVVLLLSSFMFK